MRKTFTLTLLVTLFVSCSNQKLNVKIEKMKVVNFDECYSEKQSIYYSDSVLIFFEEGFNRNSISINTNNRYIKDTISSNYLGLAWAYNLGLKNKIDTINLTIEQNISIKIKLDPNYSYISINNYNDTLRIKHLRCLPTYE